MKRINPTDVSIKDVIKELQRELEKRQEVYPRWKLIKKINPDTADHRIECIRRAIKIIRSTVPKQKDLF